MTDLGIDHLTALDLTPEQFLRAAGEAGFTSVSLRTIHIVGGEPAWAAAPLDTAALVCERDASGVRVHAIEAVAITPTLRHELDRLRPLLQQGGEFDAQFLYCFSDDPEQTRCAETLAELADAAAEFGLRTLLEPMPYRSVATLRSAADIVASVPGAAVVVDTLHVSRGGLTPADLASFEPQQLAVLQLCDAPAVPPTAPSPSGLHPLMHEARFDRRIPGEGELALQAFAAAMPASALVTVEAPAAVDGSDPARRLGRILHATWLALATVDGAGGAA